MEKTIFKGVYSAIFSIYDKELNVIDETVKKLVNYNIENGIDGFYVCGNTGECNVLPNSTRKQMIDAVCEHNNSRGKIIVHVGATHLNDVEELLQYSDRDDVDAISSLPPALSSYYKPEEIIEYYKYLSEKSKKPILAYVTPVLNCDTVWFTQQIMNIKNVSGMKITLQNYYTFEKIRRIYGDKINILNGPDETALSGYVMGADGAIGTTFNILPHIGKKVFDFYKQGDIKSALVYQNKFNQLIDTLLGHNLDYWKQTLSFRGFDMGHTIFPAALTTKQDLLVLKEKLNELDLLKYITE